VLPPQVLAVRRRADLVPLRTARAQIDGARMLDADGVLRKLGVRLVPNPTAEADVEERGGIRHTSARCDSNDDSMAILIVVSEHGPATLPGQRRVIVTSRRSRFPG